MRAVSYRVGALIQLIFTPSSVEAVRIPFPAVNCLTIESHEVEDMYNVSCT